MSEGVGPAPTIRAFETLPRRIFLDSCTAQTLRDYGGFIYESEPLKDADRIYGVTDGLANLQALQAIFRLTERAQFEWIVSTGSLEEAADKRDPGHLGWFWDIADHSASCLGEDGPSAESVAMAARLAEPRFGYLSEKDRRLLADAVALRCEAFLTVERRLPRNAQHLKRELGIEVITPVRHWEFLRPWAALWL
ncbi:hypothetical protein [Mesorhizobium sp.]|uniref:hypothetical protein n=1 Tax=Mesorhizobium sp. TaxID=1871066 RepID=UPI000FEA55CC|nr:hypothetical protein [Mesorhizobium sp.]RWP98761.1 MAG: hypothetical protein EOR89_18855 [Mesorhizobium sp.]